MSTNKKNISIDSGINLPAQTSAPATAEGNIYNLNSDTSLHTYIQSADRKLLTDTQSQIVTNKSIDASSNTISNIVNSNLSGSAGITGANIATNTVTNSNLSQMATNTIKGNNTGGTANALDLTVTQTTAMLNNFVGDSGSGGTKGLVPAPASGDAAANKFLKANGSWTTATVNAANPTGKNYFVTNSANNNFSSGSASPWSVFNTTFTNGVPGTITLSATNVTIPITSTNPLLVSQSANNLQMVKTANNSQGQGFISTAMTIDREDLAKVLYGSFSYEVVSGTVDLSGSSTQSLEIWVYNVTATTWIQVSGYRGMNQSSGQGKVVFNFQTDSTAVNNSYQVAVILRQTDANAMTINFNDFQLGPQAVVLGTPLTDWTSFIPTGTWSTNTTYTGWYRRVGDSMEMIVKLALAGAPTSASLTVNLPSGLTMDTTKLPATPGNQVLGQVTGQAAAHTFSGVVFYSSTTAVALDYTLDGNTASIMSYAAITQAAPYTFANADFIYAYVKNVPIVGWSSNVQSSSDTDTRVIAARAYCSANFAASTTTPINFDTVDFDKSGSITTSATAWKFTAPISGIYSVSCYFASANIVALLIYKNGSLDSGLVANNSTTGRGGGALSISLNAGDFIDIRPDSSATIDGTTASNNRSYVSIHRISGPSVITNTESVNARYFASSTSISGSLATVSWTTKDFDSHAGMSSGTYTIPVSGKYQVNASVATTGTFALNNQVIIEIQKNGSVVSRVKNYAGGVVTDLTGEIGDIISCNATDTIRIQLSSGATGPSIVSSNFENYFSIARIGN
jgi:hypothetical protein